MPNNRFTALCLRHPKPVLLWALALTVAGAWSASRVPVEWIPSVELPALTVAAAWPGASPRAVERSVTAPIERALRGVPGTAKIVSHSLEGQALIRLQVAAGRNAGLYSAEVSDRLAALRPSLPDGVVPLLNQEIPAQLRDDQGFMTLQLVGGIAPDALRDLAEETVAPRLRSLPGISGVVVEGGRERELRVTWDSDRLRSHQVHVDGARTLLLEAFVNRSYGWLSGGEGRSLLLSPAPQGVAEVERLPLSRGPRGNLVRLGDVARVGLGPAPVRSISRIDGKPVVTLVLSRAPGTHLLAVAAEVRRGLESLNGELPAGVEASIAEDRSEDVRKELRDLGFRGGLGLLAVACALLFLLRARKAMGIVLASVTLAVAVALALMKPLGLTFNLLTLAGLVLLMGLLFDNATVVVQQILARRSGTVLRAVDAVRLPLVSCTATTVVAVLPVGFLDGELRGLFAPFALLSAVTLTASLASALILVPVLGQSLARPRPQGKPSGRRSHRFRRLVLAPCRFGSRHPRLTLFLLLLAIGLPTPLLPKYIEEPEAGWASPEDEAFAGRYNETLGDERVLRLRQWLDPLLGGVTRPFLERVEIGRSWDFEERPEVKVWLKLPPGSGIEKTDELLRQFEGQALASAAVERTIVRIGEDFALLRVLFPDAALRTPEPFLLRERLISQALRIAGLEVAISGLVDMAFYSGLGDVSGFRLEAYGPSYDGLAEVAAGFAREVEADPRVAEIDVNAGRYGDPPGREVLRFRWDAEAVARTGVQAGELSGLLRARLFTWAPSFHTPLAGDRRMSVRLLAGGSEGQQLARLEQSFLAPRAERQIRLAGLSALSLEREPPAIEREDQRYKRYIEVFYRGPQRIGQEMIDRKIQDLRLPPGYRVERPRFSLLTREARQELLWTLAATLGLVFLIIAGFLESWRMAACALLCVPMAWVGVALGFLGSGESFAEGAFLGSILTIGLAVNSGILLADRYRRLRLARRSAPRERLALLAIRGRLRPLWITTAISVTGMLPVLLVPGADAFWKGLAVTVVGGLLSSSLLAPVAMAALLSSGRSTGSPPRSMETEKSARSAPPSASRPAGP